ncbi:hypothetical protein VTJ83DRAFT_6664 [Remersonia thermophila]|uniref:Uncharacterized protein n=1 Tax=Remersonia thermophila TaxID=72144 RepID=A0ABR4D698_9PEZI
MRPRSPLDTEADTWRGRSGSPTTQRGWTSLTEGGVSRARLASRARIPDTPICHRFAGLPSSRLGVRLLTPPIDTLALTQQATHRRVRTSFTTPPSIRSRRIPPDRFSFLAFAGLQYATFISAAQRGVLITRAAYDICEEEPVAMATLPVAKGGEPKKKMSLMDYHNKKKSAHPGENGLSAAKAELKTNGTGHAKPPLPPKDDGKKEWGKTTEKPAASRQPDAPLERTRPESNGEGNKPSSAKSKIDHESRKRPADADDNNPSPQKRTKADAHSADHGRSRPSKPESPRGRPSTTERAHKDAKNESLHPTINGLPPSGFDRDREASASPRSTIQVNGSRARSNSATPTPRKPENPTKPALPKLLSPLHPALFDHDTDKSSPPKKKPASTASSTEKTKPKKAVKIPEPLSPTLPPVIEEILADMKRKPTTSKEASNQQAAPEPSSTARKTTIVAAAPGRPSVDDDAEKPARPTKLVTLKLNKSTAKRAKVLLSLPSKSAKEALRRERSESADTAPPVARKRPATVEEAPQEPAAPKRNKAAADVITARPPTTPLKPAATAMSRVTSSQSQGPGSTPAAGAGHTPDNRPPTRSEPLDPKALAQAESHRERHAEYGRLGSKLKHARDDLRRDRGANMSPADERRVTALHFEMMLAYMVAFHSLNQARLLERRSPDIAAWESLLPHFSELRSSVSGNRALKALAAQMHVVALEQITNGFAHLDPATASGAISRWMKHHRNRAQLWPEAQALSERVDEARLRAPVGPWMTVDDAVAAALAVMKRWADKESRAAG